MKQRFMLALLFVALGFVFVACQDVTTTVPATTAAPTTVAPTTVAPTTVAPTTVAPTTVAPTTIAPTTVAPTTVPPTTMAPTTTLAPTLDLLPDLDGSPGNVYGVYKLAHSEGVATITYDKYGLPWSSMDVVIDEDVSRFNKLVITARGEGVLLVQFIGEDDTYEVRLNLTVNNQTFQIDLRDEDAFLGTLESVALIAAPGVAQARGEIVISELKFDIGTAFGTVRELGNPGFNATYGWVEHDEDTYTFTTEMDDSVTFAYTKAAGQEWSYAKNLLNENLTAGYNTLTVVVSGTATKTIMVKLNNVHETTITFDGTVQTITIPLGATLEQIAIFAEPNTAPVSGTFSLKSLKLSYVEPVINQFSTVDFVEGWVDNDGGIYSFTTAAGVTTVDWVRTSGQAWASIKNTFTDNLANLNTITLVVQGTAGQQLIIKPNNNNAFEKTVDLDGTEQTVVITMTQTPEYVIIFVDPILGAVAGSFDIIEATVTYVAEGENVNLGWTENDVDTYDFTYGDGGIVTVDYTKNADQAWAFMKTIFDEDDAEGMNTMVLVLRGTPGKRVLIKPNNSNALETWITFKDDQPHFVYVTAAEFVECIIFAEPEVASVTGSLEILRMVLFYAQPDALERDEVVDFVEGWVDNDGGIYTFTTDAGVTTVDWVRTSGQAWASIKNTFTDNLANHNTITLVVQGTAGEQLIIKPNNNNAFEKTVNLDGTEQTVVITMTETPEYVIIFVDPILGAVTGSFDIIEATVAFVATPLEVTDGWAEHDAGTYTIDQDNVDGSVVVNYATTDTYQFMINNFDLADTVGLNTATIVVQGTVGKQILLKPNDAAEIMVTFDGTEQTFIYTADVWSKYLIMAAPGVAGGETGTFTIVSLMLTYVEPTL